MTTAARDLPRPGFFVPSLGLWHREVVRFLRQRNRVAGALLTPVVFWVLLGAGFGSSFRAAGTSGGEGGAYLAYFFPGTLVLVVFFTAIYSTISIIEDRKEGFLQSVLVAPIPRSSVVAGKVLGGTTVALLQAVLFLLLAPTSGISLSVVSFAATTGMLALVALGLTGLGFLLAWRMESTQGFHVVMNLVLMPLWLLSGSLFPASGSAGWLSWLMVVNPLTYAVAAVRHCLYLTVPAELPAGLPSLALSSGVTAVFSLAMFVACAALAGRRSSEAS
jgi:ABC-2 type transport system permease protein